MLLPIAACGGILVRLDWPALTPAPTEIRMFTLARSLTFACHRVVSGCEISGRAGLWLFSSRRQAHFLLEYSTGVFLKPNVRAKRRPTAWRDGQAGQNGAKPQPSLDGVPSRWASA